MAFGLSRKVIFPTVLGFLSLIALTTCTSTEVFRNGGKNCSAAIPLGIEGTPADKENVTCATVRYSLPTVPGRTAGEFTMSFLELSEQNPKQLKTDTQMLALQQHLATPRQKYVIVFIHGWRHDADVGNEDVRRFQTLLAYSRSFLDQRVARGRLRTDVELVGVYVGWRGARVKEFGSTNPLFLTTFLDRKSKSEAHAQGIVRHLKSIESSLQFDAGDRMLVVGHSFGGNILATALKACLLGNPTGEFECGDGAKKIVPINDYKPDQTVQSPVGNLTVLINPASEARNWTELQRALRKRYGRPWKEGETEHENWPYESFFLKTQKPTYLSVTSTDNWDIAECGGVKCKSFDWATGTMFPLGQSLVTFDNERRTAIGHLFPSAERPFGATHEVVTNGGSEFPTMFKNSYNEQASKCDIEDGWLLETRRVIGGHGDWDTGDRASKAKLFVRHSEKPIWLQFRQALSPEGSGAGSQPSYESPNTPFWNIRAAQSTVDGHGAYVNYPFWCTLNQMVLDDMTAPSASHPM